jgi:hypothetical protein
LTYSSDDNRKTSTEPTSPSTSNHHQGKAKNSHEDSVQLPNAQLETDVISSETKRNRAPSQPSTDLALLYTHRLSHVAETGQLVPRSKWSPAPGGEWSRTAPARECRPRHPPISMNNRRISKSLPTTPTNEILDPFNFPQPNIMVTTPSSMSLLSTALLQARNSDTGQAEMAQDSPSNPPPPHLDRFYSKHSGAISAIATLTKPEPTYAAPKVKHDRGGRILRKVNDGFEILQPGTISVRSTSQPPGPATEKDRSKRHSRRLSKERPSTNNHNRNSFIEVLYGDERRPRF